MFGLALVALTLGSTQAGAAIGRTPVGAARPPTARQTAAGAVPSPVAAVMPIEAVGASVTRPARRLRQSGGLIFPMKPEPRCQILDSFGDPRSGGRSHEGVDIMATLGQEVYAVADATITTQADATASLSGNAWGLTSVLTGTYYFYAHLSAFAPGLALGQRVNQGDLIGYVGDTGNPGVGNYHLHFEVHPGSQRSAAVNPIPLLQIPTACSII